MMRVAFTVYAEPVAQGRPRMRTIETKNGRRFTRPYDPPKSREWKKDVRRIAQDYAGGPLPTGPLALTVKVYRHVPKGFSRRKRELALAGEIRPSTKPDLGNYVKGVEDALQGVLYRDDSQIVSYGESGKWYGDPPRLEIIVEELRPRP